MSIFENTKGLEILRQMGNNKNYRNFKSELEARLGK